MFLQKCCSCAVHRHNIPIHYESCHVELTEPWRYVMVISFGITWSCYLLKCLILSWFHLFCDMHHSPVQFTAQNIQFRQNSTIHMHNTAISRPCIYNKSNAGATTIQLPKFSPCLPWFTTKRWHFLPALAWLSSGAIVICSGWVPQPLIGHLHTTPFLPSPLIDAQ